MKDNQNGVGLEELKAYMRYKNVSQHELAEATGMSIASFNQKVNQRGDKEFTNSEIVAIGEYLDLDANQILRYFFSMFIA